MPQVGPGGDNVTGDRYTLDLGIAPDLGNLLQNLQVANDYLDQAEQRFRTINDVVGNTTQRLAAATRQTQLLAAETQRLQNSYAAIATSTMGMANMGGMMPMGMGMGMGMGGMYPGSMPMYQPGGGGGGGGGGVVMEQAPPRYDVNAGGFQGGQSTVAPAQMPNLRFVQLEQGKEFLSSLANKAFPGGRGNSIQKAISQFKGGYSGGSLKAARIPAMPGAGSGVAEMPSVPGVLGDAAAAEEVGGGLASLGGLAAEATPYGIAALAGLEAAKKIYGVWAGAQAESRRVAGLTGGEAGVAGMLGNNAVPGTIALSARARWMSLLNPGVDYGEVQDRTLGAGYVEGKGYSNARDYLFESYKKGLGTTIDQIDLYKEAVDKAGASTQNLNDATDSLRKVASNTNASIDALMQNMQAGVEQFTGQGYSGTAAVTFATQGAQAYAANTITALNPNLREAGSYNPTGSPYSAVRAATIAGVPGGIGGFAPYMHSGNAMSPNVLGEQVARQTLMQLGFKEGMSADNNGGLDQFIKSRGWGAPTASGGTILSDILNQFGVLPANLDVTDYPTLLSWIYATINIQPEKEQADKAKAAMQGVSLSSGNAVDANGNPLDTASRVGQQFGAAGKSLISPMNLPGAGAIGIATGGGSLWSKAVGIGENISGTGAALNILRAGRDAVLGVHEATQSASESYVQDTLGLDAGSTVGGMIQDQFSQAGATTSPLLEKILSGQGQAGLSDTFVKDASGSISNLSEWISRTPDWQKQLQAGTVQIAHAGEDTMKALNGQTLGVEGTQVAQSGALQFGSSTDESGAVGAIIDGTKGEAVKGSSTVGIDDNTIYRLADQIGKKVHEYG